MNNIGEKIKENRKKYNMTQQDVADTLFVDRGTVSKWERNESVPNLIFINALSELFHMSLDEFTGLEITKQNIPETDNNISLHYMMIIILGFYMVSFIMGFPGIPCTVLLIFMSWKRRLPFYMYLLGLVILFRQFDQFAIHYMLY